MKTLVAFSRSTRAASFHTRLIRALPALAPDGVQVAHFDLSDVPFYNQDMEDGGLPESVTAMRAAVAEADGVILAAPEYNGSYSALTKNTIDWLTRPMRQGALMNKKIMVIAVTPGPGGGQRIAKTLSDLLPLFGNEMVGVITAAAIHEKMAADSDTVTDDELAGALRTALAAF